MRTLLVLILSMLLAGCGPANEKQSATFGDDLAFLRQYTDAVLLQGSDGAQAVVVPQYQGRVMTTTATGPDGLSFGWLNRERIQAGTFTQHINVFGGEDRFWIGPEGGQFSIFFKKETPFDMAHWFTPASIDTEPFELVSQSRSEAVFSHEMTLVNYSDTRFDVRVDRTVRLLDLSAAVDVLGLVPGENIKFVGVETENTLTNIGDTAWRKETGLLSIWILGMFNPTAATTVVVPYQSGDEAERGRVVTDDYFGVVPPERLVKTDSVLYFKCDGQYRSKIGLSPQRARPVLGSYDAANQVLTIVQYTKPEDATDYVNSLWKLQEHPYQGDAVNSYNDGPNDLGEIMGPFYELETSSPAAVLAPAESITHIHRTFHFTGPEAELDIIAIKILGVSLADIQQAFQVTELAQNF